MTAITTAMRMRITDTMKDGQYRLDDLANFIKASELSFLDILGAIF
jgi:hypothetical protein